jgi:hypothetical protein
MEIVERSSGRSRIMTGNTFAPDAVARAVELIRSCIDPHELRRQVHREHQELTALGTERVLAIAHEEIAERISREGGMTVIRGTRWKPRPAATAAGASKPARRPAEWPRRWKATRRPSYRAVHSGKVG